MRYTLGRLLQANDADYRHKDYGHIDPFYALPFGFWYDTETRVKYIRLAMLDLYRSNPVERYVYSNLELNDLFDRKIHIGIYCQTYTTL